MDEARSVAETIGWPVALKTAAPGVAHKSDANGVHLSIVDADALLAAYEDIASRLGPQVTVAAMAPPGIEVVLLALVAVISFSTAAPSASMDHMRE